MGDRLLCQQQLLPQPQPPVCTAEPQPQLLPLPQNRNRRMIAMMIQQQLPPPQEF